MKYYKFHQFVLTEKGKSNTAIIDFLKKNIYQVPNRYIDDFQKHQYESIGEFILSLKKEELIIEIESGTWVPQMSFKKESDSDESVFLVSLDIEDGANIKIINQRFRSIPIKLIRFYGKRIPHGMLPDIPVTKMEKDFSACLTLTKVDQDMMPPDEFAYQFNKTFNSCWGKRIAITRDNMVRPCIHSRFTMGRINDIEIDYIINEAMKYWNITKDCVDTCKNCELRYHCFDCREIISAKTGNLYGGNPFCNYDPASGSWNTKNVKMV